MNIEKIVSYFEEREANIRISHSIYGEQTVVGKIKFIDDGQRIGVKIGSHEIFLYVDEVRSIETRNDRISIIGDIMNIEITQRNEAA